jgi:uncharacterized damage-inducible protein DinB
MADFDGSVSHIDASSTARIGDVLHDAMFTGDAPMTESAEQYIQRITGHVDGKQPLAVQAATAAKLEQLCQGASASALRNRPGAGAWSVSEIVAHLADAEIVIAFRMRLILGAPGTPIAAYDQDAWASSGHYETRDPRASLVQLRALRDANLALLESLTPEQWQQYGIHSERGQETIEHIVRMTAGHDINHLEQIERLLSGQPK